MSGIHPSEETLQQYVLDRAVIPPEEIDHIGRCPDCQAVISAYTAVTTGLEGQPAPVFNFDLAAAVMERVQVARAQERLDAPPVKERKGSLAAMWAVIVLIVGISGWLFRKSAYFVFTDMSPDFYWIMLVATGIVVGLFVLRLHKKYLDVINLINK